MKKSIIGILALALFAVAVSVRSQPQKDVQPHGAVLFVLGEGGDGALIAYDASVSGFHTITNYTPMAPLIAELLDAGFRMEHVEATVYTFIR